MQQTRVLGVRVDCVDTATALDRIEKMVESGGSHFVATVNPEFVMRAGADPDFARVLESADLCIPDGSGVVWAARRHGCAMTRPVAGVDLVPPLARMCARRQWRMFLLGAAPGVAASLATRLAQEHPGMSIASHAGSAEPAADAETFAAVAAVRPHVLLVAFGAPKQELWIDRARARMELPVAIGVGGAFDFLTGRVPRAPAWLRRVGMEWAFRLVRQPWRAGRMAVLPVYAYRVLRGG